MQDVIVAVFDGETRARVAMSRPCASGVAQPGLRLHAKRDRRIAGRIAGNPVLAAGGGGSATSRGGRGSRFGAGRHAAERRVFYRSLRAGGPAITLDSDPLVADRVMRRPECSQRAGIGERAARWGPGGAGRPTTTAAPPHRQRHRAAGSAGRR